MNGEQSLLLYLAAACGGGASACRMTQSPLPVALATIARPLGA